MSMSVALDYLYTAGGVLAIFVIGFACGAAAFWPRTRMCPVPLCGQRIVDHPQEPPE